MQDAMAGSNPSRRHVPWNKGKLTGAKPPLRPKHVWSIRSKLQLENRVRDLAMFNLAIDSKLRGCDVVALKVEDVAPHGHAVDRATVRQRKTGRPVRFELTEPTREAVDAYLKQTGRRPGEFMFPGRGQPNCSMTTRQYARLIGRWIGAIGLDPSFFGTHSLRRTKATLIYRRTGNLRAVQLLLGHTKIESTVRYLGIEVDDALAIAEQVDV
jgi:integrase